GARFAGGVADSPQMDGPPPSCGPSLRRFTELRVVDLKAQLRKRNLDASGNKSVLMERLSKAVKEEGGNSGETSETPKNRTSQRMGRGRKIFLWKQIFCYCFWVRLPWCRCWENEDC
uniref:SAP domain-containing protein n=1 Tax=Callorhinchus milii TaxID=7868 RepID=A0A4W3K0C2_CALMI